MKIKSTVKKITDAAMLLLLPVLAAEIQLGQESHEWLGIVMLCLFVLHHVMNYKWFAGIWKGEYSAVRAFVTMLNLLLFLDFLALAYSGPRMSGFALQGLRLPGSMMTARTLHLFASEWSLLLMAVHTGVHSGLHGKMKKTVEQEQKKTEEETEKNKDEKTEENAEQGSEKNILFWLLRGGILAVSVFGIYSFWDLKMPDYLFLQTHFVFFDETKSLFFYMAEVVCMMVLFSAVGHFLTCFLKKRKLNETGKKAAKTAAFLIPVLICIVVIFCLNYGGKGKNPSWGNTGTNWGNAGQTQGTDFVQETDKDISRNPDTVSGKNPENNFVQSIEGEREPEGGAGQMQQTEENRVFTVADIQDGFLLIKGGTFSMGSPESENWRGADETLHTDTGKGVSDGGSSLDADIEEWLEKNHISVK